MARDFVVAPSQQWKLFSLSGPRKQGLLFAVEKSRRDMGTIILWERSYSSAYGNRPINRSRPHFSSINPPPLGLVAQKVREPDDAASTTRKTVRPLRMVGLKRFASDQWAASVGKLRKRKPKMIARTPIITAYQAIIQISAAAPASGFQKRRPAKMIEARPIRIRNHSPLISRRILIASAISVAPIIKAQAAM